jgi:hypothetical protein
MVERRISGLDWEPYFCRATSGDFDTKHYAEELNESHNEGSEFRAVPYAPEVNIAFQPDDNVTAIHSISLPDSQKLLDCALYVISAWSHPEMNVSYDLHEGMRRLESALKQTPIEPSPLRRN